MIFQEEQYIIKQGIDFLDHHGIKGMRWGIRKERKLIRADKKWQKNIYKVHSAIAIHNNVADKMNNGGLAKLNKKYENIDTSNPGSVATKRYMREYEKMNESFTAQAIKEVHGISPSGRLQAKLDTSGPDWRVEIRQVDVKHSGAITSVPTLIMELEHEGNKITFVKSVKNDFLKQDSFIFEHLEHFGIKGMRWGIRNDPVTGVSKSISRQAKNDASEFARAKQFTGEGAGNRRKHIKTIVESRSKDPNYAKAFKQHLSTQDMSKHVSKAKAQRSRLDRNKKIKQRTGFLARRFTGEMGTQAAFTALVIGGGAFLASPKGKAILNKGFNTIKNSQAQRNGKKLIFETFRR